MLVWLASYPRSGNTMLRALLHRMFAVAVPSVYEEGIATGEHEWGDLVPRFERPPGMDAAHFADWARNERELFVTKTHQMPDGGNDPAIVIVRDGRAAMASFERYTANFGGMPSELEEIVIGAPPLLNWSDWIAAWTTRTAPTLLLRYEQIAEDPQGTATALARFLDRPIVGRFDLTFEDFKAVNPKLFAVGGDGHGISEVERRCPNLFWALHGEQMQRFGYDPDTRRTAEPITAAAAFQEAGAAIRRAKQATSGW